MIFGGRGGSRGEFHEGPCVYANVKLRGGEHRQKISLTNSTYLLKFLRNLELNTVVLNTLIKVTVGPGAA